MVFISNVSISGWINKKLDACVTWHESQCVESDVWGNFSHLWHMMHRRPRHHFCKRCFLSPCQHLFGLVSQNGVVSFNHDSKSRRHPSPQQPLYSPLNEVFLVLRKRHVYACMHACVTSCSNYRQLSCCGLLYERTIQFSSFTLGCCSGTCCFENLASWTSSGMISFFS